MNLPVIILGGGGHAEVIINALQCCGADMLGVVDQDPGRAGQYILGLPVIGGDATVSRYGPDTVYLVNGLGTIGDTSNRRRLYESFKAKGYTFASVIHPSAIVASNVFLGEGVQVMAGAVIQPGCEIGDNVIINTRASVDHDCKIGDHTHVAPGVTLSGMITIGKGTHIGTGATVIQGVSIGVNAVIGAGAVVLHDVPDGAHVYGVPAKEVGANESGVE